MSHSTASPSTRTVSAREKEKKRDSIIKEVEQRVDVEDQLGAFGGLLSGDKYDSANAGRREHSGIRIAVDADTDSMFEMSAAKNKGPAPNHKVQYP